MDIYLAGGISGNLRPLWAKIADEGGNMKIYLAGNHPVKNGSLATGGGQKILESFYYARDNKVIQKLIPELGGFLLDSGAFSFVRGKKAVDWDAYTEDYANFINKFKIDLFLELDIDRLIGLKEVLIANHGGDHAIYPDCRDEFIASMSAAMEAGTYEKVKIFAPYTSISKAAICLLGANIGVDYSKTYSCYKGGENHCGKCGTCVERKEAFQLAGVPDPTKYEE